MMTMFCAPATSLALPPLSIFQEFQSRIASGRAHDPAARMRRRAAHVKIPDGRAILRPARRRPQEEELFEGELSLKDVAFGEAELALQIERREHLPVQDQLADVR